MTATPKSNIPARLTAHVRRGMALMLLIAEHPDKSEEIQRWWSNNDADAYAVACEWVRQECRMYVAPSPAVKDGEGT